MPGGGTGVKPANSDCILYVLLYCRITLVPDSCQSKHKKRKRHFSEDSCKNASSNSAVQLAAHDVDMSISLVSGDCLQESHVSVEKNKKFKSHPHTDDHSTEDIFVSNKSVKHGERKRKKKATNECLVNSSQKLETFPAAQSGLDNAIADQCVLTSDLLEVQPTGMLPEPDNLEQLVQAHSIQPQTAVHTVESVENSSMTGTSTPADSDNQMNDSNFVNEKQELKLSHSAKRRRRRHRARKRVERKDEGGVSHDEQGKTNSSPGGCSLPNVSCSNKLPTVASHSLVSGFGRTHIIFDNANSDNENTVKAVEAQPTTCLAFDKYDSRTAKDHAVPGSHTVVTESILNNSSDVEAHLHLQNENTLSNDCVSRAVKKASSAIHSPSKTRVHPKAKSTPFANVQVFCRQRVKKLASTCLPRDEALDTTTALLLKQASILHYIEDFIAHQHSILM